MSAFVATMVILVILALFVRNHYASISAIERLGKKCDSLDDELRETKWEVGRMLHEIHEYLGVQSVTHPKITKLEKRESKK